MAEYNPDVKYAESHEWARQLDDNIVEVGISDYAQESLGDVVFVELPEIGTQLLAKEECCAVASSLCFGQMLASHASSVTCFSRKSSGRSSMLLSTRLPEATSG